MALGTEEVEQTVTNDGENIDKIKEVSENAATTKKKGEIHN